MNKATKRQMKYDAVNTVNVHLKLNKKTDAAIIAKLQAQENKQGYVKRLILADLGEENNE